MSGESDIVDRLAQSIADGTSIDWAEINTLPADDRLKRMLALLRMVDEMAEVHRSIGDEPLAAEHPHDSALSTPAPPEPGAPNDPLGQWGHLLLRRKIGEGAFGEVYHAHDTWLDHPVALKLFKPRTSGRNSANRILHEARKLARIRHPNVVTVHGADSHDGRVGFWMDLIEGTTLETIVRGGRLSAGEATYIGQEVCRALAAVHLAGIVHRDVKALNVMRASDDGRIILMDFGAGEFIADQPQGSRKQGTPLYLAPEVFAGADATIRSDIYAVGVLLYFLVTGDYPVRGASVRDLADAHRRGDRRRLRDARPDLSTTFVSIVERALDPDPRRRFASAGEMDAALAGGHITGVMPLSGERFRIKEQERTALQTAAQVGLVSAVMIFAIELLGLIASRAFDVALAVDPDFSAGFRDDFSVGVQALLPFAVVWVAGAVALAGLTSLRPVLGRRFITLRDRTRAVTASFDGETLATLVFLLGIVGWLAICWRCRNVFAALEGLRQGSPTAGLWALASAAKPLHRDQVIHSALLTFFLGLAAWQWLPVLEKGAANPSKVRLLRWALFVLIFVIAATATVPRRLVWERFEVVSFENEPALVIGRSGEELLLYRPYRDTLKHRRVRRDAPLLERTAARDFIFDRR